MRKFIYWVKSNVLTAILAVLVLASLVLLGIVHFRGSSLRDRVAQMYQQQSESVRELKSTPVKLPPEQPDGQVQELTIPVSQSDIEALKRVYEQMDREYAEILAAVLQINRTGHLPMLEGLFPDPGLEGFHMPYLARTRYLDAFAEMLQEASSAPDYPRLDAGLPPSQEQVNEVRGLVQSDYLKSLFPIREQLSELKADELQKLHELQRAAVLELYTKRAESLHVYAETNPRSPQYPFDVGAWATASGRPTMPQIWEGQMGLWIQQDLVEAISRANRVMEPEAGYNVIVAPVKRLHAIRIVPGYLGIDSAGAIMADPPAIAEPQRDARPGTAARSAAQTTAATTSYTTREQEQQVLEQHVASGESRLLDDFSKAPTGRSSNTLYDVRQVWLVVDADVQQLPAIFEAISRVNFMTILKMKLEDVDEYALLQDGFVYGQHDVVRVSLLIETIWLREWITPLMPDDVKRALGIKVSQPAEGEAEQSAQG